MPEEAEDCFYFLNSACRKGEACGFRHSAAAKESQVVCPEWAATRSCTVDCPMRHTTVRSGENYRESNRELNRDYGSRESNRELNRDYNSRDYNRDYGSRDHTSNTSNSTNNNNRQEFCYFETTTGCTRDNCEFKHRRDFYRELERENQQLDYEIDRITKEIHDFN